MCNVVLEPSTLTLPDQQPLCIHGLLQSLKLSIKCSDLGLAANQLDLDDTACEKMMLLLHNDNNNSTQLLFK